MTSNHFGRFEKIEKPLLYDFQWLGVLAEKRGQRHTLYVAGSGKHM